MAEQPKVRTMQLPVELDEATVLVRAREMASLSKERTDKAIELTAYVEASKGAKKTLESELAGFASHLARLGTVVRTAREDRAVEVSDEPDYQKGVVNTVRLDTNAVVGTRGMTEAERQRSLFREGKAAAEKAAAAGGKGGPEKVPPAKA